MGDDEHQEEHEQQQPEETGPQFAFPALPPASEDITEKGQQYHSVSPFHRGDLEPVGKWFAAYARRKRLNRTFSEDERAVALESNAGEDEEESDDEEESPELLKLDPKDWKKQDHYAVLGLSKLRWEATDDDIKKAFRKKVLKHHPDKKAAGGNANDDAFFKCVQKAFDLLTDNEKRRQFDSVDPTFDESLPPAKVKPEKFYKTFGPILRANGRFSKVQPVPELGDDNSSREDVEKFYDFWYKMDSWRTFEYLDEEDREADSRDEKRYIEKKNKAARAKRKKEDQARMIKLVDRTMENDPRLARFKQQDRDAKEQKKKGGNTASGPSKAEIEAQKAAEAAALAQAKAAEEEAAKAQAQDDKKEKERKKNQIRKEKKNIRTTFKDNFRYFLSEADALIATNVEKQLNKLDNILEKLTLEELIDFGERVGPTVRSEEAAKEFEIEHNHVTGVATRPVVAKKEAAPTRPWDPKESELLAAATSKFPAGTVERWFKIAEEVSAQSGLAPRTAEEAFKENKSLQKGDAEETAAAANPASPAPAVEERAWTKEEHTAFEAALRKYPASLANRFDRVAEQVKTRTSAECAKHFKDGAETAKKQKGKK